MLHRGGRVTRNSHECTGNSTSSEDRQRKQTGLYRDVWEISGGMDLLASDHDLCLQPCRYLIGVSKEALEFLTVMPLRRCGNRDSRSEGSFPGQGAGKSEHWSPSPNLADRLIRCGRKNLGKTLAPFNHVSNGSDLRRGGDAEILIKGGRVFHRFVNLRN
jgi:hypothetical protein